MVDEDSLFGSPPSSPQLGPRQVSPGLALPSGQNIVTTVGNTKNVGTIALPGSQLDSELPINPLALSLNHGANNRSVVHRPPALHQVHLNTGRTVNAATAAALGAVQKASSPSNLAGSDATPPNSTPLVPKPTRGSKKRARLSSSSSTPEPPPPIDFPDPSAPPPVGFLRNQDNLLGRAGRVGGVKAASLAHMRTKNQGSTPLNPILVEDEVDGAPVRKEAVTTTPVPPPSNEEIVSVLVGQKDIFPVLEGILKIIAKNSSANAAKSKPKAKCRRSAKLSQALLPSAVASTSHATYSVPTSSAALPFPSAHLVSGSHQKSPSRSLSSTPVPTNAPLPSPLSSTSVSTSSNTPSPALAQAPPLKKRKLQSVPAGASDWDVPFPFAPGEGPEKYTQTWEKERGKRLIEELIKMVRGAAKKAVAKRDGVTGRRNGGGSGKDRAAAGRERKEERRVNGYYRPETALYGLTPGVGEANVKTTGSLDQTQSQVQKPTQCIGALPNASNVSLSAITQTIATPSSAASSISSDLMSFFSPTLSDSSSSLPTSIATSLPGSSSTTPTPTSPLAGTDPAAAQNQHMFDTWMNFLEVFPVSLDGFGFASPNSNPESNSSAYTDSDMISHASSTPPATNFSGEDDFAAFAPTPTDELASNLPHSSDAGSNNLGSGLHPDAMFETIFNLNQPASPAVGLRDRDQSTTSVAGTTPMPDCFDFMSSITELPSASISKLMIDPLLLALSGSTSTASMPASMSTLKPASSVAVPILSSGSSGTSSASLGFGGPTGVHGLNQAASASPDATSPTASTSLSDATSWGLIGGFEGGIAGNARGQASHAEEQEMDVDMLDLGTESSVTGVPLSKLDKGKGRAKELPGSDIMESNPKTLLIATASDASINPTPSFDHLSTFSAAFSSQAGSSLSQPQPTPGFSESQAPSVSNASTAAREARLARKSDILSRAKERRKQLQDELNGVKMRLWETTVEEAVLIGVARILAEERVGDSGDTSK